LREFSKNETCRASRRTGFLHFSFVIGAAAQTADIVITSKPIRRIALLHGTMTFVFNTVLLALTVNAVLL